jgi:hypothetical protein
MSKNVYSKTYLFIDSHGNKTSATCEDASDTVQVCGMKDKEGKDAYFESDAYHLDSFARENDLQMKIITREEDFDTLWNNPK